MRHHDPRTWMLAEAIDQLQSADRLGRQFFHIGPPSGSVHWEPPVDMYEDGNQLRLIIALPGVVPNQLEVKLEQQWLLVRGERAFNADFDTGTVLRMEIPYGCFERSIHLPYAGLRLNEALLEHGCLTLRLERLT